MKPKIRIIQEINSQKMFLGQFLKKGIIFNDLNYQRK